MDGDALRATQNPLKDLYRADPRAGGITLSAQGDLGVGITCSVNTGGPEAGLHPSTRGDGSALESTATDEELDELVRTTERYLVVLQSIQ